MRTAMVITDVEQSPASDRHSRAMQYSIATVVRLVCIALLLVVPDWWRLIPAAGTVVVPYVAVVIANRVRRVGGGQVMRPGAIVALSSPAREVSGP
jgi:MFS superfamily sulfate permease-like transporter